MYLDFIMPHVKEVFEPILGGFSLFHVGHVYSHAAIYVGDRFYIHAWGRKHAGGVTKTRDRVLFHMGDKFYPPRHFAPKDKE